MITAAEVHLNLKKIVISLFIYLGICFSSYVYATDYSITSSTTSQISLNNSDTLTVSNGGSINYTGSQATTGNWKTFSDSTTTITNAGTITASSGLTITHSKTTDFSLNNSGTISSASGQNRAIYIPWPMGTTVITNSGTISSNGSTIDVGDAEDVTITNTGTISATTTNAIRAHSADTGAVTINNSGMVSGTDNVIYFANSDELTLTNSGTISASNGSAIWAYYTDDSTITNTGTISGTTYGISEIGYSGADLILVNKGTITGGTRDLKVEDSDGMKTLTNDQGASDALTYEGYLPATYKFLANSTSDYGKLAVTSGNGTMAFTIDSTSSLSSTTYSDVFTGVASSLIGSGTSGTCSCSNGNFNWTLAETSSGSTNWNLTIANADTTAPTTTFSPANGATAVAVASDITLTFNEAVRLTNDSALDDSNVDALITLKENNSSGADIAFNATINGGKTVITINPDSNLSSTQVVYVAIGATVEDAANNAINAANASFTAADIVAPTTTFSPANGATAVAVASDITLTFNEAVRLINNSALDDSNVDALITLKENNSSGADIAFNATINGGKTVITINPDSNLSSTQVVYVAIGATVEDAANNAINAANASFTAADVSAPTMAITSAEVSDGASSNDSTLAMTFTSSEATSNFVVGDISVSGGALSSFNATSTTVYTATFTPSGDGAKTIDVAGGAFTDSSSNNNSAATQFNWTYDATSPTMAITSAEVTDGATSDDSTLAMTFTTSKATSNFVVGDISVNGGALSSFNATSSTLYTATFTPSGDGAKTIDVAGGAFTDSVSNNNTAATQFNWTYETALPSPLNKIDVTSSVETSKDIAAEWADMSIQLSYNRMAWLRRHQGSIRTSHQGIKLRFRNEMIDILMNSSPNAQIYDEIFFANRAKDAIQNANGSMLAVGDHIKSDAASMAINEGIKLRDSTIGSLNPTFEPIFGDWSVWTKGELLIGKTRATSTVSKQESKSKILSLGFDKYLDNDGLIGFVLDIGQNNTDIGTGATNVKSDNYSLSNYTDFKLDSNTSLESIVGIGRINYDMTRVDGTETLLGERRADQMFFSNTLKREHKKNQLTISPYLTHSATRTNLDSFSENGGETALTFNNQIVRDYEIGVGLDINSEITLNNNSKLKPFTIIEYNKSTSKTSASMYYTNESAENAYEATMNNSNNNWKIRLGADLRMETGWRSSLSYTRKQSVGSSSASKYSNSFTLRSDLKF
ncbi:Ig-like domain-containing protein [Candidatus Thioglobus sp.]|nr:Ig-like domain-containing protein [Candidatus Thioglobus sp.]